MDRIYFDNAATTPLLNEVKESMIAVINKHYGNPSSIHMLGRQSKIIVEDARKIIAKGLNASTGEIFFTSGATESNNMSIIGSVRDLGVQRIISSSVEHHCILHTLEFVKNEFDVEVVLLDVDSNGLINPNDLDQELSKSSAKTLVSLMHVNNEIGSVLDIVIISEITSKHNALFHCDTAQSVGKIPIDLNETKLAFISGAAHKFFGPKGVGFIYINSENQINPLFHGGSQERGIRSGTENIYGIAGMAKAYELANKEYDERKLKITAIKEYFIKQAQTKIADVEINGDPSLCLYNILSLSFPRTEKMDMVMMNLDIKGISASAGSACASGVENESHVLEGIGHDPKRKTVRFSFSHFNTFDEVDYTVDCLKTLCSEKMVNEQA